MDIERVTGTIGAEVSGLDLAEPLPEETVERLREALGEYLVLFFRDQHLDVAGLKRLTLAFDLRSTHAPGWRNLLETLTGDANPAVAAAARDGLR